MATKFAVSIINDQMGGALNPAICEFTTLATAPADLDDFAARILTLFKILASQAVMATNAVSGIKVSNPAVPGTTYVVAYPEDALRDLSTKMLGSLVPDPLGTYGDANAGPQSLAVRGASMNIAQRTTIGSKAGQGRIYVPFLAQSCIDDLGLIALQKANDAADVFNVLFHEKLVTGYFSNGQIALSDPQSAVYSKKLADAFPIVTHVVQRQVSVLKTRRR